MALNAREMFESSSPRGAFPRVMPTTVKPREFAAVGAAPEYAVGTPVAFNTATNLWVVWTSGGGNGTGTIAGFIYPDPLQIDDTDSQLAQVLLAGEIDYRDIVLPAGETVDNLKAALRSGPRTIDLTIVGLTQVH